MPSRMPCPIPAPRSPAARAVVVTCSTRAAAGVYPDRGGALLVETLRGLGGRRCPTPRSCPTGRPWPRPSRRRWRPAPTSCVTTGGTGLTPTDGTPEATRPLLDREVPGIAEAIRARGVAHGIPTAMLSRGLAGLAGRTLVVNLPGVDRAGSATRSRCWPRCCRTRSSQAHGRRPLMWERVRRRAAESVERGRRTRPGPRPAWPWPVRLDGRTPTGIEVLLRPLTRRRRAGLPVGAPRQRRVAGGVGRHLAGPRRPQPHLRRARRAVRRATRAPAGRCPSPSRSRGGSSASCRSARSCSARSGRATSATG